MHSNDTVGANGLSLPMIWQVEEISNDLRLARQIRTRVVLPRTVVGKYGWEIDNIMAHYKRASIIEVFTVDDARESFRENRCAYMITPWYRDRITERTGEAIVGRSVPRNDRIYSLGYDNIITSNLTLFNEVIDNGLAKYLLDAIIKLRPGPLDLLKLLKDVNNWAIGKAEAAVVSLIGVETLWGYASDNFRTALDFDWNQSVVKLSQSSTILKSFNGKEWTEEQFLIDFERYLRFSLIPPDKFLPYREYIYERRHYATNGMAGGLKIRGKSLKRKSVIITKDFLSYMSGYVFGEGFNVKTSIKYEKAKVRLVAAFPLAPSIRDGWLAYHFEQKVKNIKTVYWKSGVDNDAKRDNRISSLLNGTSYALSYDWKGFENHFTLKLWILIINILSEEMKIVLPEASVIVAQTVSDYLAITVQGQDGFTVNYTGGELSGSRFTALFNALLNDGIHFIRDLNYQRIHFDKPPVTFRLSQGDDAVEIDISLRNIYEQKVTFDRKMMIMEMMGNVTNSSKTTLSLSVCSFLKNFYLVGGKITKMLSRIISTLVQHNPLQGYNSEEISKAESLVSNFCKLLQVSNNKYFEQIMFTEVYNVTGNMDSISAPMCLGGLGYLNRKWNGYVKQRKKVERWKYTKNIDVYGGDEVWLSSVQHSVIETFKGKHSEAEIVLRAEMATSVSKALELLSVDVDYKVVETYYGKVDDSMPSRNSKPVYYGGLRGLTLEIGLAKKIMFGQDFWNWIYARDEFAQQAIGFSWILRKLGKGFGLDYLLGDVQGSHSTLGAFTARSLKYSALQVVLKSRKSTSMKIKYGKILSSYATWVAGLDRKSVV